MGDVVMFRPRADQSWDDLMEVWDYYLRERGANDEDIAAIVPRLRAYWDQLYVGFLLTADTTRFSPELLPEQLAMLVQILNEFKETARDRLTEVRIMNLLAFADLELEVRRGRG